MSNQEGSPQSGGDTGLNFVLQNVASGQEQQYSGLATLGRLLGDSQNATPPAAATTTSNNSNDGGTHNNSLAEDTHNFSETQIPGAIGSPYASGHNLKNVSGETQQDVTMINSEQEEHQQQLAKEREEREQRLARQEEAVRKIMSGTGEFENRSGSGGGGHYVFNHARAATGEGLYRVFDVTNKSNPTVQMLVPQIAPHLSMNSRSGLEGYGSPSSGRSNSNSRRNNDSNNKNSKNQQQNGSSPNASSSSNNKKSLEDNDKDDIPYVPYSTKAIAGRQQQQQIRSPNQKQQQQQQQSQQGQQQQQQRMTDRFGLHCLFDAAKDAIEAKPRRLPKLRIAGLQREVGDNSVMSSGGSASATAKSSAAVVAAGDVKKSGNEDSAAAAPSSPTSQQQHQQDILHSPGASAIILTKASTAPPALLSWATPWPFQLDRLVMASGRAAQQAAMESFVPISPIFTDTAATAVGGTIAAQMARSVAMLKSMKMQQEQDEQEAAAQQQAAAEAEEEEAHRLRQALAEKHANDGGEEERDVEDEMKQQKSNDDKASPQQKKPVAAAPPVNKPHPPPASTRAAGTKHAPGFLPRTFKVAPIPQVLPSLITVTSARHPSGIVMQAQQQLKEQQKNNNDGDDNAVDWSGNNNNTITSQQQQQQPEPVVITARMRNKARNFTGGAMSTLGALVPLELQNTAARGRNLPKHRDVRKIENKADKLRCELEHFKTMRRIRSGEVDVQARLRGEPETARTTFRQHQWDGGNANSNISNTARGGVSSSTTARGGIERPRTPPKSFLALHGLRANESVPHSPGLPSVRGGVGFDGTHGSTASGGGGGNNVQMTVATHPPVPWSRQVAVSASLSARFTQGKYNNPDRAQVVAALMD